MDYYFLAATVTFAVQIVVLAMLIVGFGLERQKRFRQHGFLMVAAVILHLITILVVMVPALGVIEFTFTGLPVTVVAFSAAHAVIGLTALMLGIWLSASWRLRQSLQYCAPKKIPMLVTFTIWIIALVMGITLFFMLYLPLMA